MDEVLTYRAVVLDLDGVITDTREFHFKSWKKVFDKWLYSKRSKSFSREDYQKYVDGEMRRDGIRNFFLSREIHLSNSEVEEIAQKKNEAYLKLIAEEKLSPFRDAQKLIKKWHDSSIPLAIVSSSENCRYILEKLNMQNIVQAIVDGTDGKKLNLHGKPSSDFFTEALKRLNLQGSECIAVEDSVSGIKACKEAGFGKVYGITREKQNPPEIMYQAGADAVITSLEEIK